MNQDAQAFARGRHLALALVASAAYLLIRQLGWAPLQWLGLDGPWHGSDIVLQWMLHLLTVLVPAWLAFTVLDTRSGVELLGSKWKQAGWLVALLCVVFFIAHTAVYLTASEQVLRNVGALYRHFERSGQVAWGWLIGFILVFALVEELLFRALIQRALEGYVGLPYAVAIQALLFELFHVVSGSAMTGGFFFGGVVFGLAFGRTRNLALVVVMHAAANLVHAGLFSAAGS